MRKLVLVSSAYIFLFALFAGADFLIFGGGHWIAILGILLFNILANFISERLNPKFQKRMIRAALEKYRRR